MQTRLTVVAAIVAGALAVAVVLPGRSEANYSGGVGRWQIINPTPNVVRNTMLLNTETGETWLTCGSDGEVSWCYVPRTNGTTRPSVGTEK